MDVDVAEAVVSVADSLEEDEEEGEEVEVATGGFFTKCAFEVGWFFCFADDALTICFLALVGAVEDVSVAFVDAVATADEESFFLTAPVADGFADDFGFGVMPSPTARIVK